MATVVVLERVPWIVTGVARLADTLIGVVLAVSCPATSTAELPGAAVAVREALLAKLTIPLATLFATARWADVSALDTHRNAVDTHDSRRRDQLPVVVHHLNLGIRTHLHVAQVGLDTVATTVHTQTGITMPGELRCLQEAVRIVHAFGTRSVWDAHASHQLTLLANKALDVGGAGVWNAVVILLACHDGLEVRVRLQMLECGGLVCGGCSPKPGFLTAAGGVDTRVLARDVPVAATVGVNPIAKRIQRALQISVESIVVAV